MSIQEPDGFKPPPPISGFPVEGKDGTGRVRVLKVDAEGRLFIANPGGGGGATFVEEDPIGTIDGVNAVFTLTDPPVQLWLYRDGLFMTPGAGNDYTLTGSTITYEAGNVPQVGQTHHAVYSM